MASGGNTHGGVNEWKRPTEWHLFHAQAKTERGGGLVERVVVHVDVRANIVLFYRRISLSYHIFHVVAQTAVQTNTSGVEPNIPSVHRMDAPSSDFSSSGDEP